MSRAISSLSISCGKSISHRTGTFYKRIVQRLLGELAGSDPTGAIYYSDRAVIAPRLSLPMVIVGPGEVFLKTVQPALLAISASAQSLRIRRERKTLSVACIPSIATRWLIPALPRFTALYPDITIEVAYSRAHESFAPERHDILITHQNTTSEELSSTLLFSRINKPVASSRYLETSRCDAQLNNATLLHDEVISAWEDWLEKAGYRPEGLIHGPVYQDFNLLATAVIAGHGVALCPIEVFRRELSQGDLVVLSNVSTLADQGYYLICDKNSNKPTKAFSKWFVDACSANSSRRI